MIARIIDYCRTRKWPKIIAVLLLITVCWTAWWFFGRTPFTASSPKPQTTVSAQKHEKKKTRKTTSNVSQAKVDEWVRNLDGRMDDVYSEQVIDTTTIRDFLDQRRSMDHFLSDNVENVDALETKLSDLGKEYTMAADTSGKSPSEKLDDLEGTFDKWKDAVYLATWRDIYNTQVDRSYDALEYALKGIAREDLPEQCQSYESQYGTGVPDYPKSQSNRKILDYFKTWYKSFNDSLDSCLSHPNQKMSENMSSYGIGQ